jgi:protein-S-isoprenylcysteine O-methyltransferase Ste14
MGFLGIFPVSGFLIIIMLIIFKVKALKKRGISVRADGEQNGIRVYFLYAVLSLLFIAWLSGLIVQTFQIAIPNQLHFFIEQQLTSILIRIAGAVFIFLSVLLMFFTMLHFKLSFRFGMNRENQGKLVTKGIFSRSRNPFFLSIDLYFIGQALVFTGIVFAVIALLAIIGIHLFILKEEKYLLTYYRKEYLEYMKRVRRYC